MGWKYSGQKYPHEPSVKFTIKSESASSDELTLKFQHWL